MITLPRGSSKKRASNFTIKEMEVFCVSGTSSSVNIALPRDHDILGVTPIIEPVNRFSKDINEAISVKQYPLVQAESDLSLLEKSFEDERAFIEAPPGGDAKDTITLNVSGATMDTKRSTLCTAADSALAQQFDDSNWTEQGCNTSHVPEWTHQEVANWAEHVPDMKEGVCSILKENEISGRELIALNMEGLERLGINEGGSNDDNGSVDGLVILWSVDCED